MKSKKKTSKTYRETVYSNRSVRIVRQIGNVVVIHTASNGGNIKCHAKRVFSTSKERKTIDSKRLVKHLNMLNIDLTKLPPKVLMVLAVFPDFEGNDNKK